MVVNGDHGRPPPPSPRVADGASSGGRALFGTTSRHPARASLRAPCRCEGRRAVRRARPFPVECLKTDSPRSSRERHCAVAAVFRDWWARAHVHTVLRRRAAGPRMSLPPVSRGGEAHPASTALTFGIREDRRGEPGWESLVWGSGVREGLIGKPAPLPSVPKLAIPEVHKSTSGTTKSKRRTPLL